MELGMTTQRALLVPWGLSQVWAFGENFLTLLGRFGVTTAVRNPAVTVFVRPTCFFGGLKHCVLLTASYRRFPKLQCLFFEAVTSGQSHGMWPVWLSSLNSVLLCLTWASNSDILNMAFSGLMQKFTSSYLWPFSVSNFCKFVALRKSTPKIRLSLLR